MDNTEAAFDDYALSYDSDFTHSSVGMLQRKRVWNYLEKNISPESFPEVLELNCGTGEDALWFSKKGFNVTATDLSQEMIAVAKEKMRQSNATVFQSDIQSIHQKTGTKKFNLIFSDFGGLNCLSPEELKEVSTKFSQLLSSGGRMIFVVMGRNCKWEQFYFKRKNDLENAFRRKSIKPVEAVIFEQKFSTWYYSPNEMKELFAKEFNVNKFKPIGIALPPSYMNNYFRKHPTRLKLLNATEKILGNFSSLSDKADHYIIDFTLKQ
jgi:ubiquinone/menaquinone biosynthesis C-methylase UbiE